MYEMNKTGTLWLTAIILILFINTLGMAKYSEAQEINLAMSNKQKSKFRFEDYKDRWKEIEDGKYKTTQQGLEELKSLHPFGSKLIPLVQTLTDAGAVCSRDFKFNNHVLCVYVKGFIVSDHWRVVIKMDEDVEIETIKSGKYSRLVDMESENNRKATIVSYQFVWGLDGP